jgi:hypothetical protein
MSTDLDITIAEKARRQFMIMEEQVKQEKFLMAALTKYLAFQLDASGELRKPPNKSPTFCMLMAKKHIRAFVDEVYELKDGDSPKGIIQDIT